MTSRIGIYELATGRVRPVLDCPDRIEAPNFLPGGEGLLVNGGGRLFRVPFAAPGLVPFDSGFADHCNNDHGFSPDGRWLALSHHAGRGSEVFVVPAAGGAPQPVTRLAPSWFHGWSPDGARIAYAAVRQGRVVDICTAAADGSDERRLTNGEGHADGPDYSADGRHIYYNCDRGGHAQIWRMGADGGDQVRLFADARVNWFPHPSPDGRWVSYLSYPPGTAGHPADLPVQICLMRPDGSDRRVVVELRGGQGTMNVPHWSADGRSFAFVAYEAG